MEQQVKKKKIAILILSVLLVILSIFGYRQYQYNQLVTSFKQQQYFNEENLERYVTYYKANKEVDKQTIELIVNHNLDQLAYDNRYPSLLVVENYDETKNDRYLTYLDKNEACSIENAVFIVNKDIDSYYDKYDERLLELANNENFDVTKAERYLSFLDNYQYEISRSIQLVNYDFDLSEYTIDDQFIEIIDDPFFLITRIDRYYQYRQNNPTKTTRDVVAIVNCNRDYKEYTNVSTSNLEDNYLIITNKYYKLPDGYVPDNLVTVDSYYSSAGAKMEATAYEAFKEMVAAANAIGQGIKINGYNGYRSYDYQSSVYNHYKNAYGVSGADECSARAGYSEHQTGLAVDVYMYNIDSTTWNTKNTFQWLEENCYKYGFIQRYAYGKTYLTGYIYENWHYRYVGKEVAQQIHDLGITYDEYYTYFILGE